MTDGDLRQLLISDAEWHAMLRGARALRQAAADLRQAGAETLAADREGDAAALEGLARRAVVMAAPTVGPNAEAER